LGALSEVDVFLPNEVELCAVGGRKDPQEALEVLSRGDTLTVAKLGADGCMALENGKLVTVPAFPVRPVDTTGAGDSFNAGFLHAWLRKWPLVEALRFAAACGAISTLAPGGTGNQASEAQAKEMIYESSRD
jgi:sugar/nucleoside kinase (ribokinase family)